MRITHTIRSDERRPRQMACGDARVLAHPFTDEPGLAIGDAEGVGIFSVWLSDQEVRQLADLSGSMKQQRTETIRRRGAAGLFPQEGDEMFRQGDVLILPVDGKPAGCQRVKREKGRVVLAHGEVTGHAHAVKDKGASLWQRDTGERFLVLEADGRVTHEEHGTIALPAGTYEVRRQREYSPEEIRNVAD